MLFPQMFPVYVPPPEYRVEYYSRSDLHIITLRVVKLSLRVLELTEAVGGNNLRDIIWTIV